MRVSRLQNAAFRHRFRFANKVFDSFGKIILYLDTPNGVPPIPVELDLVQADIPALLGIDVLDREGRIADTVANRLTKRVRATSYSTVPRFCITPSGIRTHIYVTKKLEQCVDEWSIRFGQGTQ